MCTGISLGGNIYISHSRPLRGKFQDGVTRCIIQVVNFNVVHHHKTLNNFFSLLRSGLEMMTEVVL